MSKLKSYSVKFRHKKQPIPEQDIWLYKNLEALAIFRQGLAEAAEGKVTKEEDFSVYADDEID